MILCLFSEGVGIIVFPIGDSCLDVILCCYVILLMLYMFVDVVGHV